MPIDFLFQDKNGFSTFGIHDSIKMVAAGDGDEKERRLSDVELWLEQMREKEAKEKEEGAMDVEDSIEMDEDRNDESTDPIPGSIKKWFWTDKEQPNLDEYDAIGFDADHTFVKYNVIATMQLLVKVHLEDLVKNCDYP